MSDGPTFDEAVIRLAASAMACGVHLGVYDLTGLTVRLSRSGHTAALGDVLRDDAIRLLELRPRLAQDIRDALAAEKAGAP